MISSDPRLQTALASQGLTDFDSWWQLSVAWLEPPNRERGGWSGVGRWQLPLDADNVCELYVKRQQNHLRRTALAPFSGVPTFMMEYRYLTFLRQHGIKVPEVVYFGSRQTAEGDQAVLVTVALSADYQDFSQLCDAPQMLANGGLLEAVAKAIRQLHQTGVQHRALYPKHVFVARRDPDVAVAFIDLEKARNMPFPRWQAWRDLKQFLARMPDWTEDMQFHFYQVYTGRASGVMLKLGWWWLRRALK